jgi:hypothetical protein
METLAEVLEGGVMEELNSLRRRRREGSCSSSSLTDRKSVV